MSPRDERGPEENEGLGLGLCEVSGQVRSSEFPLDWEPHALEPSPEPGRVQKVHLVEETGPEVPAQKINSPLGAQP